MGAIAGAVLLFLALSVAPWRGGGGGARAARALNFTRADFPGDFVFGAGTSAYQVLYYRFCYFVCSFFFCQVDDSLFVSIVVVVRGCDG